MSRVVKIIGSMTIDNLALAKKALSKSKNSDIKIVDGKFEFNQYDYYYGKDRAEEIKEVEKIYNELVAEEERAYREAQRDKIIENALKHGYKLKKEVQEDETIRLVLVKRVY
jgi:hypothetical protein